MNELNEIIKQCKKGERPAQAELYTLFAPTVLGICVRYLQDREEAEDLMQDVFVKIFTVIKSFKNEGSFEGWIKKVTVNSALDALKRKNKIQFERGLTIVEHIEFVEEETLEIDIDEVIASMNELPLGYRTILNMGLVEEFTHKEIAEKLGIQESTSRSQYARARQALLKLLQRKINIITEKKA